VGSGPPGFADAAPSLELLSESDGSGKPTTAVPDSAGRGQLLAAAVAPAVATADQPDGAASVADDDELPAVAAELRISGSGQGAEYVGGPEPLESPRDS
jgi:hypothetical protein